MTIFADTLLKFVDDYANATPSEMLTVSRVERHTTNVARVAGSEMVTALEILPARVWDESNLKQSTGGDTTAGRPI